MAKVDESKLSDDRVCFLGGGEEEEAAALPSLLLFSLSFGFFAVNN